MPKAMVLIALSLTANTAMAATVLVNCGRGDSLNHTLAQLNPNTPNTVLVQGTCAEYVEVLGFSGLHLRGLEGAKLVLPGTPPPPGPSGLLKIGASRSIVVEGFTVESLATGPTGVAVGHGSTDVLLRNLSVTGGSSGIVVYERSQVGITQVTVRDPGYTPLGIYDVSDVHLEAGCLFENTSGTPWHPGIDVDSGHLTVRGVTIRNMQVGMWIRGGATVNVQNTTNYAPAGGSTEVLIENPAGTNNNGVELLENSTLLVSDAVLRITNAGQSWGGWSGGIWVSKDSSLDGNNNLFISGSQGQGILVMDTSHVVLNGSSITGSGHGGLVAANQSTLMVSGPGTTVSGNAIDLFCDSKSVIVGSANVVGATTVQCGNLLSGTNEPLP